MQKKLLASLVILIFTASFVFASGFSIYEHGSKAMALSGAFAAKANDVSALFYNPAGITQLEGFNLGAGGTFIIPTSSFTGPTDVDPNLYSELKDWNFLVPNFYASYAINEDLSAGFGFFVPFGLGTDWGTDWVGKHLTTKAEVQAIFLNPVVAYRLMEGLSVAVGFEYVIGRIILEQGAYFTPRNIWGDVRLDGNGNGTGINFGLHFQATDQLSFGVNYRSNVTLDIEGDATFEFNTSNPVIKAETAALFPDNTGKATLELPTFLSIGVAYDPIENLTVEFDWLQIGWTSYDKLEVDFDKNTAAVEDQSSPKNWKDVSSFRIGVEYRYDEQLALRTGFMIDQDPAPDEHLDPLLPSADRTLFSIGAGYKFGDVTIDGAYMFLKQDDRTITTSEIDFNGTYKSLASLFSLSFSYAIQ